MNSRALRVMCHSAQGKDCPAGMALLKFAELTYKNNFVFFCSISRPASEKCSSRSENYCGEILGKVNVERVSRAAKAALLDPAIVRGSYLDSCTIAIERIRELAGKNSGKPGRNHARRGGDLHQAGARTVEVHCGRDRSGR